MNGLKCQTILTYWTLFKNLSHYWKYTKSIFNNIVNMKKGGNEVDSDFRFTSCSRRKYYLYHLFNSLSTLLLFLKMTSVFVISGADRLSAQNSFTNWRLDSKTNTGENRKLFILKICLFLFTFVVTHKTLIARCVIFSTFSCFQQNYITIVIFLLLVYTHK